MKLLKLNFFSCIGESILCVFICFIFFKKFWLSFQKSIQICKNIKSVSGGSEMKLLKLNFFSCIEESILCVFICFIFSKKNFWLSFQKSIQICKNIKSVSGSSEMKLLKLNFCSSFIEKHFLFALFFKGKFWIFFQKSIQIWKSIKSVSELRKWNCSKWIFFLVHWSKHVLHVHFSLLLKKILTWNKRIVLGILWSKFLLLIKVHMLFLHFLKKPTKITMFRIVQRQKSLFFLILTFSKQFSFICLTNNLNISKHFSPLRTKKFLFVCIAGITFDFWTY